MKRKLLLFFAVLSVSIGAWAQNYQIDINNQTWTGVTGSQNVAKIQLNEVGVLSSALAELNSMNYNYQMIYIDGLNNEGLTEDDILALGSITCETIDLQDLKAGSAFTFSNSSVKNVILPDGWDKDEVKAAGEMLASSNANFGSCLSQDVGFQYKNKENVDATGGAVVAYVNKCNTLYDAMVHTYFSSKPNTKLSTGDGASQHKPQFDKLKSLTIMGYPSASDFSTEGDWDSNGHFVPNYEAFEFSAQNNARLDENGDVKLDRASYVDGTKKRGAVFGCSGLVVLDLRDAVITEEHCADLTLSWTNTLDVEAQQIWIPTTPLLKTIPADFLSIGGIARFQEICIPANIENIRTRAFSSSSHNLVHVWTTGTDDRIVYDNGAWITDGKNDTDPKNDVRHFGMADLDTYDGGANFTYGTYTFSENIKLIESNAFSTGYRVKDVYCLGIEAPECHVDAFTSVMYNGFNTYDQSAINEGIIDREAYTNNMKERMYMTMLHYPRESQTPHIQRYTDPTRVYNVATGLRDGRGNNIYFPNQSEFTMAYAQGTSGYVWQAWDDTRTQWGDMEIAGGRGFLDPHTTENQIQANGYWEANTYAKKNDRSFYDVTLDGLNMSTITAPSGLDPYYNIVWEGEYLYPQPETVGVVDDQGNPVMETVPERDPNGNIIYDELPSGSSYEGNYTRATVQQYVEASDGTYCHQVNQDGNGQWTIDYNYNPNPTGAYCKAPWDANTWTTWDTWMGDIPRYDREISGFVRFDNQKHNDGRPRFNISDDYVDYASYNNEYKIYLTRYNVEDAYVFSPAQSGDPEPYYMMRTQQVQAQKVVAKHDYRGWHQFVLAAYAHNLKVPMEPIRSFITDNDWWTICVPYDLKYDDMIMFFGTEAAKNGGKAKIPYLSKLMYVVRDQENEQITLMFSKNLMEYKETMSATDHVHGTIKDTDESGKYSDVEIAQNPVILHAGVPYLIRPNMTAESDGSFNRQFDIFADQKADLYNRLVTAAYLGGSAQMDLIYGGEYTVPAYVVGTGSEGTEESKTISNKDGSEFTYQSGTIKYKGKDTAYKISTDFTYTFVGSYYKSVMPKYCYFLGWDSENNCASFWYNRVEEKDAWNWNNETGIICPNFNTNKTIDPATSLKDPARWILSSTDLANDDFPSGSAGAAKAYTMDFGATNFFDSEATGIEEVVPATTKSETISVYNVNGVFMGNSVEGLAKGIYIVNGKKYVVK